MRKREAEIAKSCFIQLSSLLRVSRHFTSSKLAKKVMFNESTVVIGAERVAFFTSSDCVLGNDERAMVHNVYASAPVYVNDHSRLLKPAHLAWIVADFPNVRSVIVGFATSYRWTNPIFFSHPKNQHVKSLEKDVLIKKISDSAQTVVHDDFTGTYTQEHGSKRLIKGPNLMLLHNIPELVRDAHARKIALAFQLELKFATGSRCCMMDFVSSS